MSLQNGIFKRILEVLLYSAVGAICVAAANGVIFLNGPVCSITRENTTGNQARSYANWIEHFDKEPYISIDLINRWFAGEKITLDTNDVDLLPGMLADVQAESDGWSRPFHCVRNQVSADGRVIKVGVYSFGEDGHSASEGNDPDDLNSWGPDSGNFYRSRANLRTLWAVIFLSLLFATPFYLFLRNRRVARSHVSP